MYEKERKTSNANIFFINLEGWRNEFLIYKMYS